MGSIRIELNKRGIRQAALYSPEVGEAVLEIAEGIASRARSATEDDIAVDAIRRKDRVGARISREDAAGEANDRALGRSIGGV